MCPSFSPLLVNRLKRSSLNGIDPHHIETAVIDVLLRYFKHPENFKPDEGKLIDYLYSGAYRNLRDYLRKEQEHREFHLNRTI